MNKKAIVIALLAVVSASQSAKAQSDSSPFAYPGSFWNVTGNTSPVEKNNFISSSYAEQGITVFNRDGISITPYVSLSVGLDSKGYDWNNKNVVTGGLKLSKHFGNGVASIIGGIANENHWKSGLNASSPFLKAEYWAGWGSYGNYPGSSWGAIGNTSPIEKHNVIAAIYAQQGIVAKRFDNGAKLVPFIEASLTRDTEKYDWNNKRLIGVGFKITNPDPSCGCEVGVSYQNEHRSKSGSSASNVMLFAKFWFGRQ